MKDGRAKVLVRCYNEVKDNVPLVDLNAQQMAGYYLCNYPNDPIGMLNEDIHQLDVPYVVGTCAKTIISAVRGK